MSLICLLQLKNLSRSRRSLPVASVNIGDWQRERRANFRWPSKTIEPKFRGSLSEYLVSLQRYFDRHGVSVTPLPRRSFAGLRGSAGRTCNRPYVYAYSMHIEIE